MGMTREELDAKLEALEARSDAKFERMFAHMQTSFAELRAELQTSNGALSAKIDTLAARSVDKITAAGLLLAAIALVFAMIAFGGDQFSAGREVSTAIAALDARIDHMRDSLPAASSPSAPSGSAPVTAPARANAPK